MSSILDKVFNAGMSRRDFIKASAAATAGIGLTGCGNSLKKAASSSQLMEEDAKWISAACWHNCGGRCVNKVLVKDGVVIRQKTDDTHPDSPDFPQQRACPRGRSQRKQVFGVDRLKYPMKRKHWEPGGGRKELRGEDEWVRISWDEALDIVASEFKRIKEKYGNRAFFLGGGSEIARTMALYGGYVNHYGTTSWGSWRWGPEKFGMAEGFFAHSINDRLDLRNSELIVIWGANPAWSAAGNPTYHYLQAKKAGAKFVIIDPFYTDTAEVLEAQWIPIRPATDHAMLLGLAYTLITEDDPVSNPLIDWEFLNNCTVGFDENNMPEWADPKENLKDYILGKYDGTPKTPEWASEICGVEPDTMRVLARNIGRTKKVALLTGWAPGRTHNSDSMPQMFMALGAMTGNMGLSGCMTGVSCHFGTANGGPRLVINGGTGVPGIANPVTDSIVDAEMWDAILNGKYTAGINDQRDINIQLIYHGGNAVLATREGTNKGIEAHRKVEFVVSHSHFLTTNSKYADLVLPVTTAWEREGGFLTGNRELLVFYTKVTEPLYEAKDDIWIAKEIAARLGLNAEEVDPISEKQKLFNQLAGARVINAEGTDMETLVTITAKDIAEWGVEGVPQQGRITLKDFMETGVYQVPRSPGDNYGFIAYEDFRKDPAANPLNTETGKLEIHCRALKEFVDGKGFTKIDPIPTYNPAVEGYEATFADWDKKIKGEYPLQVMNPHYMRRSHTVFENISWLREAFTNPVYLNARDAFERGIKHGETVLIKSRHGKTLRIAYVTERLMPGVVALNHGAWIEVDKQTGIDKAGADNVLTGQIPTGQAISGWNSCICEVEKWDGEPLIPDVKWPARVIF